MRRFSDVRARLLIWSVAALILTASCTARGPMQWVPEGVAADETVTIFEASNRAYGPFDSPRRGRSPENRYSRITLRVPDGHTPGNVQLPGRIADPKTDFLVAASQDFDSRETMSAALHRDLHALPPKEREIIVFVPGFNMTEAQSLVRVAQLRHDLDLPGITALYSWPSAGSVLGYAYDRDSTLFSRDGYEEFLRAIIESGPRRMVLVGHSMGAHLTMEVLRQIAACEPGWVQKNVGGVVLISPDIDIDVFRSQISGLGRLPDPFAIFVSENDRVLILAERVSGDSKRLGTVTDPAELADLDVVLLDVSQFAEGIGHFDLGTSPALLSIVGQMAEIELSFDDDPAAQGGLFASTILTVRNATRIIISP